MSKKQSVFLSRKQLYQRVWQTPMQRLSRELGMSDVGLKKLCRRTGIPTPPQGYHLMSSGVRKEKLVKPLPVVTDGQNETFYFEPRETQGSRFLEHIDVAWDDLQGESPSAPNSAQTRAIERVLKRIKSQLKINRSDERGIMLVPTATFPVRVAPASFSRAQEILRRLLSRLVAFGANPPEFDELDSNPRLEIQWLNYRFRIRIEEVSKRIEIPPEQRSKQTFSSRGDRWAFVPAESLTLEAHGPGYGGMTIRDGRRSLEDRVDDLVKKMFTRAMEQAETDRVRADRRERALVHLRKKDDERRELEYQVLLQKQLVRESRQWQRAVSIRAYVDAVDKAGAERSTVFPSDEEHRQWVTWARKYADQLDPVSRGDAGTAPSYPEAAEIKDVPHFFLEYDDPEEAEEEMKKRPWWGRY